LSHPPVLLLKEISAAYFGFCHWGSSPAWLLFIALVGDLAQLCAIGFVATAVACFTILRIAGFHLVRLIQAVLFYIMGSTESTVYPETPIQFIAYLK